MKYIYCFECNKNNYKYIGQSNDPERRKREHKSTAFNRNSRDYNIKFYQYIREFGWNTFKMNIIEECEDDIANEREKYWIKELHADCNTQFMYDKIDEETVCKIKEDIINLIPYSEIGKRYNVSVGYISMINNGHYHSENGVHYPLVLKGCVDKSWMKNLIIALCTTKKSFRILAEELSFSEGKIKNFNYGKQNKLYWARYPLRENAKYNLQEMKNHFPS